MKNFTPLPTLRKLRVTSARFDTINIELYVSELGPPDTAQRDANAPSEAENRLTFKNSVRTSKKIQPVSMTTAN
jgi:hypothetical protein